MILELGRALILLGLLPLSILLYGLALEVRGLVVGLARHGPVWLARDNRWVLLAVLGGSIFTVAQLAFLMRDFSSMKVIYTFPALVCFLAVFMRGFSDLTCRLARRPRVLVGLYGIHALLLTLYVADIGWLIGQQW